MDEAIIEERTRNATILRVQAVLEPYKALSLDKLGKKIGVTYETIRKWRAGESVPRSHELNRELRWAQATGDTERAEILQALIHAINNEQPPAPETKPVDTTSDAEWEGL